MHIRSSLALLFVAAACASACVVLLLDSTVAMRPRPTVTAAAPAVVIESPEPDTSLQLARLAFVEAEAPPLRLETLHDLTGRAPNTAWTEGTIVESEDDPAPEALTGWADRTQVKLAVVVPPARPQRVRPHCQFSKSRCHALSH